MAFVIKFQTGRVSTRQMYICSCASRKRIHNQFYLLAGLLII
jgi:hypothetical protein